MNPSTAGFKGSRREVELHDRPGLFLYFVGPFAFLYYFNSCSSSSFFLLLLFLVYQEKKPYIDKAAELKALAENGEGSDVSPSCLLVHNIQQLK